MILKKPNTNYNSKISKKKKWRTRQKIPVFGFSLKNSRAIANTKPNKFLKETKT